jgi:hypothetical protein
MSTLARAHSQSPALSRLFWVAPLAGLVAGLANVLLYLLARAAGVEFLMPLGGPGSALQPLPIFMPFVSSFVPALVAGALYAALGRFVRRPTRAFVLIAAIFLILSFGGPLSLPVTTAVKLALSAMHVVAGVVITGLLVRLGR